MVEKQKQIFILGARNYRKNSLNMSTYTNEQNYSAYLIFT